GICACRASCLIFSAIARLSSPLPSRSLLIGVSSTESKSRRRRGASVSLSIGTPERADMSLQTWLIDGTRPMALGTGMRRNVAAVLPPECNVCYASHQQNGRTRWRSRKGPAYSQAVSITERLRANSGRLRANAGFRERGERYWILPPD